MDDTGHSGFTLFELLLAVSLVALLAGLAVPAMARLIDSARLRGAAEALVQELRLARNRALTHRHSVYFSFARDSAQQWCYGWSGRAGCDCRLAADTPGACIGSDDTHLHRQSSDNFPRITLGLASNPAALTLRFSAIRGTATAASVRLANDSGEVRVIVSPLGRVRSCAARGRWPAPC